MRVLTWNIRHGGGARSAALAERIVQKSPDVAVLTEFRNNASGKILKSSLVDAGLSWLAFPDVPPKCNTVLIASRERFIRSAIPGLGAESYRGISACFPTFNLFGFYFPGKVAKKPIFQAICNLDSRYPEGDSLLIGDFNTGRHYLDENKATFIAADCFDKLEALGWIDTWRSRNPDVREFSWYSQIGNGFRIDHAFASESLNRKISSVVYSHKERSEGISDHSILLLDFE